jgi:hypothetical protein
MVAGRESVAELRSRVEIALLRRIEDLTASAPIEGIVDLATAYAQVCSTRTTDDHSEK